MKKNNPSSLIRLAEMMKPYMKYLYFVFFCVLVSICNTFMCVEPFIYILHVYGREFNLLA